MKKRVSAYMLSTICPACHGKRLRPEALTVKFAGYDIAEISALSLKQLMTTVKPYADGDTLRAKSAERVLVTKRITSEIVARLHVLLDLGSGISQPREEHTYFVPGGITATSPGNAAPFKSLRRRLRTRRAIRRSSSVRYRIIDARSRCTEAGWEFTVRRRA